MATNEIVPDGGKLFFIVNCNPNLSADIKEFEKFVQ